MRHLAARVLIIIGSALVALGRRIDGKAQPGRRPTTAKVIILQPGRGYRRIERHAPGKWEVFKLGLSVLFNSLAYGLVGV